MDRIPTAPLVAVRHEARTRIEFCTVSTDRKLETALITDDDGHQTNTAQDANGNASARCYAGDFFSPLLIAARTNTLSES